MAAHERRVPELLRHAPAPGVRGFAALAAIEATARAIMLSVYPLAMYRALGEAERVSEVYFLIGLNSLCCALMVPTVARLLTRRWTFTFGALLLAAGALTAMQGGPRLTPLGLAMTNVGVVTIFICFNAYLLDFIDRSELGRSETLRLFYSAVSWTVGPVLGVTLWRLWEPAPFLIAAGAAATLLAVFWRMRLGNGKLIAPAARRPNPLRFLPRFLRQPRLVAGWTFAVIRSSGWWAYVVYMPIFAVEAGLGETIGGAFVSLSSAYLFITPLMMRWMRRRSVRFAVRAGFAGAALFFTIGGLLSPMPIATLIGLALGAFFLILLDLSGGLPFLMAVRPHERTEMAVIYSSFRDVSGIVTPGLVRLVLVVAPLPGVFVAAGAVLFGGWLLAGTLHPRLGAGRKGLPARAEPPKVAAEA